MSDGIFPDEATIWIEEADVTGSALDTSDIVSGEISNFSESGGEKDTESIPVFGGGNIDKESPRSQFEISLDVQMQYAPSTGDSTKWDAIKFGDGLTSATEGTAKSIFIQWSSGSNYYTRAYNNVKGITFSPTSSADGNLTGTMTFKCSPTTAAGTANVRIAAAAASTISWS